MSKQNKIKKEHNKEKIELLEAFESYRRRASELSRMRSKHKALLSAIASRDASSSSLDKELDMELERQEKEKIAQKIEHSEARAIWREKQRNDQPTIVAPFDHERYQNYKHTVGSYMLLRPDQSDFPDEDLSGCGVGSPKKFWKIGWYYLYDDRILAAPPPIGIHFTHVPYPLQVNEMMPIATNERPWLETYYAVDGPVSDVLRLGAQGANGGAHFEVAYGIDIGDSSPCGIDFRAVSEVSGIVDVGGYSTSENIFPHVDFSLNINVYQYRCLGASISEVDLFNTPVYRSWNALSSTTWESWEGEDNFSVTDLGLYSIEPFRAEIHKQVKDVKAGDSFLFRYTGSVFASESGVQLSHNDYGTWIIKEPVLTVHHYPGTPDFNWVVVNPDW
jgi:hypothetical protein